MIITATFTGQTSKEYQRGEQYRLKVIVGNMAVKKTDGSGMLLYNSLSAFLRQWNQVSVVSLE